MTSRSRSASIPSRGEIWNLRFDPSEGAEITKIRPAVVTSIPAVGSARDKIPKPLLFNEISAISRAKMRRFLPDSLEIPRFPSIFALGICEY